MKRRLLSTLCALALCLGLLPATALAADPPSQLIVGGVTVVNKDGTGTGTGYYTYNSTNSQWEKWTESVAPTAPYFHYDGSGTLTLNGATITGVSRSIGDGAGIYAAGDLTIVVEGTSTVTSADSGIGAGIYVYNNSGGTANLTITGSGALTANGGTEGSSSYGVNMFSTGNASLTVENSGSLKATGGSEGVYVCSLNGNASLAVENGGSLKATGGNYGVDVYSISGTGTASLTVSGSLTASTNDNTGCGVAVNAGGSLTVSVAGTLDAQSSGGVYLDEKISDDSVAFGKIQTTAYWTNSAAILAALAEYSADTKFASAPCRSGWWITTALPPRSNSHKP